MAKKLTIDPDAKFLIDSDWHYITDTIIDILRAARSKRQVIEETYEFIALQLASDSEGKVEINTDSSSFVRFSLENLDYIAERGEHYIRLANKWIENKEKKNV